MALPKILQKIVYNTGDETIGGYKTFDSTISLTGEKTHGGDNLNIGAIRKTSNNGQIIVQGGNGDDAAGGGKIVLDGPSHSATYSHGVTASGGVSIFSRDGTDTNVFVLTPTDGYFKKPVKFEGDITVYDSGPYINFKETDITKGTGVDSGATSYAGIQFHDKNSNKTGALVSRFYASEKSYFVYLMAYDCRTVDSTDTAACGVLYWSTGVKSFIAEGTGTVLLGTSARKWKEMWCTQSSINSTSDERLKDDVSEIPSNVLDAWGDVNWIQYKFKDAKAEKGNSARYHTGSIAQSIDKAFKKRNLDVSEYGFFLHDTWEATEEQKDDKGHIIQRAQPAGDEYGLRYTEALCMEAAYNRRRSSRIEDRLAIIEEKLSKLEKTS